MSSSLHTIPLLSQVCLCHCSFHIDKKTNCLFLLDLSQRDLFGLNQYCIYRYIVMLCIKTQILWRSHCDPDQLRQVSRQRLEGLTGYRVLITTSTNKDLLLLLLLLLI